MTPTRTTVNGYKLEKIYGPTVKRSTLGILERWAVSAGNIYLGEVAKVRYHDMMTVKPITFWVFHHIRKIGFHAVNISKVNNARSGIVKSLAKTTKIHKDGYYV